MKTWCDVQQEVNEAPHAVILDSWKRLERFFENWDTDKFKTWRRWELCRFFRAKFGRNWKDHVRQHCGLDGEDFEREFVRFVDPLWGFWMVELYAYGLGFKGDFEASLCRWRAKLQRDLDADPIEDPAFDHRLRPAIRSSRGKNAKKGPKSAYWTHPDLVPLIQACKRPFNPLDYAPSWARKNGELGPATFAATRRGKHRRPMPRKGRRLPRTFWLNGPTPPEPDYQI
jgi:hypothetical protein